LGLTCEGYTSKWVRVAWSCAAVLAVSPLALIAQTSSTTNTPASISKSSNQVSAHELQIPRKAREAFDQGTHLLLAKSSEASIAKFQLAIRLYPDFYEAYYKIGLANVNLQRYPEAQSAFERSIALSKGRYAPSQFGLAVALCAQKEFDGAEEAVRAGLDAYPDDAAGNFTLGWVQFRGGHVLEAEKSARQAILSNPNLPEAYLLLAQIHLRQNNLSSLISDVDAYLRLDPEGAHKSEALSIRSEAEQLLAKQQGASPVVAKVPAQPR
jgi:tetratricopeptide (TPR) repeat protein